MMVWVMPMRDSYWKKFFLLWKVKRQLMDGPLFYRRVEMTEPSVAQAAVQFVRLRPLGSAPKNFQECSVPLALIQDCVVQTDMIFWFESMNPNQFAFSCRMVQMI